MSTTPTTAIEDPKPPVGGGSDLPHPESRKAEKPESAKTGTVKTEKGDFDILPGSSLDFGAKKKRGKEEPVAVLMIAMTDLFPSPTNPRKVFDGIEELAESIKAQGLASPLIVRPENGTSRFEVVLGGRRYRALQYLDAEVAPCLVRQLSGEETLELQIVENLQRKDVTVLEEAEGIRMLMKMPGTTVELIAQRVGKSKEYVYQRLQASRACKEVREALESGAITAAHVQELVRLQPADQKLALAVCGIEGKDWKHGDREGIISAKSLRSYIQRNFTLNLDKAPFGRENPHLHPTAGACKDCEKRDGNTCLDGACYRQKRETLVRIAAAEIQKDHKVKAQRISVENQHHIDRREKDTLYGDCADGKAAGYSKQFVISKEGACPDTRRAVWVDGPDASKPAWICGQTETCKVHGRAARDRAERKASPSTETKAQKESRIKEEKRAASERQKEKFEKTLQRQLAIEILKQPKFELSDLDLRFAVIRIRGRSDLMQEVIGDTPIEKVSVRDLHRVLMAEAMSDLLVFEPELAGKELAAIAKRHGISPDDIRRRMVDAQNGVVPAAKKKANPASKSASKAKPAGMSKPIAKIRKVAKPAKKGKVR